jgi:hypothetical protein
VLHSSRFQCLTPIARQIIYYLTRGVPRGQITRYFGYHSRRGSEQLRHTLRTKFSMRARGTRGAAAFTPLAHLCHLSRVSAELGYA